MPRKPRQAPVACQYFTWRLFRREGVYYADGRSGSRDLGKHSLGTRDRAQALEALRRLDQKKAEDLGLRPPEASLPTTAPTIEEGWCRFLDYCGRSPVLGGVSAGTLKRYQAVRDHHLAFCARRGIENWNAFDKTSLERYADARGPSCAYRTLYFELTVLKGVVKWLVAAGRLPAAATLHYALRKPQGSDTYCYSRAEVAAMLAHCHAAPRLQWLGDVILALAHTGMRIGELAGLRWRDVDLRANTLHVADERTSRRLTAAGTARTTKGRRSRRVPIHPRLRQLLLRLPRTSDGRVFHAERGGVLRPRNVLTIFIRDVIEPLKAQFSTPLGEIGFADGRLHSLRHFFCSQAFLGGASEGEIRDWLGHADSKLVELYRHLRNDDAQRKMEAIDFLQEPRLGVVREVS